MASPTRRILVADDQAAVRDALRLLLKGEGFQAVPVTSPAETVAAVQKEEFDLALIDLNYTRDTTSGQEGLDLLGRLLATEGAPPVVVMTAWATVDLAVEAMRRGARDFIQKPWENARVLATVRTQIELAGIRRRNARLESENSFLRNDCGETTGRSKSAGQAEEYVAGSAAMRPVLDTIASVGPADAPVLITGENGTGKGLAARLLHAASARADKGLVSVNMGGLSENIFESELFGHVKARSPTPRRTAWAASSWPTAARCSWMKSPTCRWRSRPSCCGCWKRASSSAWAPRARSAPTCGC